MITIAEKNKVIAKFMGQEYDHIAKDGCLLKQIKNLGQVIIGYHCSWGDLMLVVEKIESMKYFIETKSIQTLSGKWYMHEIKICDNTNTIKSFDNPIVYIESDYSINESKKSVYYKAIVKFIEWYNKNAQ